jgi:hypothetical protein
MAPSVRATATRFGLDRLEVARVAYRSAEFARYFARGYRWALDMPEPVVTPVEKADGARGELERMAARTTGPGIFKWRHFFGIYERHLASFRGQPIHVVEVGIYGGGSLALWRDYLGPDAYVHGVDIEPDCKQFESDQIDITIGDQSDTNFWASFVRDNPRIDIVIDDGGHLAHQQATTLECLLPHLQPGGVYVCEDIHGAFQPFQAFVDGLTRPLSEIKGPAQGATAASSLQRQIHSVHRYPIATVIEKNASTSGVFESGRYGTEWPDGLPPGKSVVV